MKNIKGRRLSLNDGELNLMVTNRGDIAEMENPESNIGHVELTASELDRLASASVLLAKLGKQLTKGKPPEYTRVAGHCISFIGEGESMEFMIRGVNGDVWFGCQRVTAAAVARVHKLSLAMRKANKGKRK